MSTSPPVLWVRHALSHPGYTQVEIEPRGFVHVRQAVYLSYTPSQVDKYFENASY